jgi:hypothetical protein
LLVTYSHHLLLHGLLIHHLPTFCHLFPSTPSSWPTRSSLVCLFITCSHHLLPCNLLLHHLPTFSSLACTVSSLFVARLHRLLIVCRTFTSFIHRLPTSPIHHLCVSPIYCLPMLHIHHYLHHMLVPRSLVCHMFRYMLNMLLLAHYLLVTCFLSHPFFLHDTTRLLACVDFKVRNNKVNYNSSHLPLK